MHDNGIACSTSVTHCIHGISYEVGLEEIERNQHILKELCFDRKTS